MDLRQLMINENTGESIISHKSAKDLVDIEVKKFSNYDNIRSIPSITDGLKVSQRKAIFALKEFGKMGKVSSLGTKVIDRTHFLHGEASMYETITLLGQDYPGSNNFPLLLKSGQFGNILNHKASAPRYIYAQIHPKFEAMFPKNDYRLYDIQQMEGMDIEPKTLFPIIPPALINGAHGIGTAHATQILPHKISDVVGAIAEYIKTGDIKTKLVPYLNGYSGKITRDSSNDQITIYGNYEIINTSNVAITEIPPKWVNATYKEKVLNKLCDQKLGNVYTVKDYKNLSNEEDGWRFELRVPRAIADLPKKKFLQKFGLIQKVTQNLTLWSVDGKLKRYDSPEDIIKEFVDYRKGVYENRLKLMIQDLKIKIERFNLKYDFLNLWIRNDETFRKLKKVELCKTIREMLDRKIPKTDMEWLLSTKIFNINSYEMEKLKAEIDSLNEELRVLENTSPIDVYLKELANLIKAVK